MNSQKKLVYAEEVDLSLEVSSLVCREIFFLAPLMTVWESWILLPYIRQAFV